MPSAWVFQQIGGRAKTLRLDGWDAPFGRPRQKAVVEDGQEARSKRTYYSDNSEPTRHIFGLKFKDWTLNGRLMDRFGGFEGYARQKVEFIKAFQADLLPISITWGQEVSVLAFMASFTPHRESPGEIAYDMVIEVDADDLLSTATNLTQDVTPQAPAALADQMAGFLNQTIVPTADQPFGFGGGFISLLDSIVDSVQSTFASFVAVAQSMQSFEQALIGDVRRFRASLGQFKTSLIIFRDTYQDFRSDLALESEYADEQLSFSALQAASGESTLELMLRIAEADRAAAIAERGKIAGFYTAKDGDTWESISRAIYGSAGRANDLREANGVPPGAPPISGAAYQIPV